MKQQRKNIWRAGGAVALLAGLGGMAGQSAAGAAEVVAVARSAEGTGALEASVEVVAGPGGTRLVEVVVRNRAAAEQRLEGVEVSFELGGPLGAESLVAEGGTTQFRHPTYVLFTEETAAGSGDYRWARDGLTATQWPKLEARAESTMFLLRRDGGRHFFAGLLTWRKFRSRLTLEGSRVVVRMDGEKRVLGPGEVVRADRLWLAEGQDWQEILWAYGREIARANAVSLPPRPDWLGWSNWDYYGGRFTSAQVLENLRALPALEPRANLVQVDGGWWSKQGDYFPARPEFEGGMEAMAAAIRGAGMTAGVHLDGTRADSDARVVAEHPEYFLHLSDGKMVVAGANPDGRGDVFYDFTHPGARAHFAGILRRLKAMGYGYFKIDFLRFMVPDFVRHEAGLGRDAEFRRYDPRLTSYEGFDRAMREWREAIGRDAYFLGCSAEYATTFGHVDGLRTGGDIDPTHSRFSRSALENGGNFYLNGVVVWNDADYLVVRGREDEDAELTKNPRKSGGDMPEALAEMWAHYVALFGGPRILGDKLPILRPERQALLRRTLALPRCNRFVPVDYWAEARHRDDPFHAFLGEGEDGAVYLALFNWDEPERTYTVKGWPGGGPARPPGAGAAPGLEEAGLVSGRAEGRQEGDLVTVRLAGRHSVVLRAEGADFEAVRKNLEVR